MNYEILMIKYRSKDNRLIIFEFFVNENAKLGYLIRGIDEFLKVVQK
jgi:hypothetical protein